MRMPGSERRNSGKQPELQMTPMIDIVFNLIIFFILTPSFEAKEGYLPTNLPNEGQGTTTSADQPQGYRINLNADGEDGGVLIWLNEQPMNSFYELRQQLKAAAENLSPAQRKEATVIISPTTGTWHKHVVAAFDAAKAAQLPKVAFTIPK